MVVPGVDAAHTHLGPVTTWGERDNRQPEGEWELQTAPTAAATPFPTWTPLPTPEPPQESEPPDYPWALLGGLQLVAVILALYLILRRRRMG